MLKDNLNKNYGYHNPKTMNRNATLIISLIAAVGIVFFVAPSLLTKSTAYDQYVCTDCGLKKVEDIRKFGPIVYHRRVALEESAISRAIKMKSCPHNWLLYRFGHSFKRPFLSAFGDGGCPSSTLRILIGDERFAQELSRMENPSKTWASLVSALNSSRAFDEAFNLWWQDSDHADLSFWTETNGLTATMKDK